MEKLPVVAVLDNVRSAGNVGAFFRTSDAFGTSGVVLCGITATPPQKEIHKTALGAELTVAWRRFDTTAEAVQQLRSEGYAVWAVEQVEGSVSLADFEPEAGQRYALVFGNEGSGLPAEFAEMGQAVRIPHNDKIDSLNLSIAVGIGAYAFVHAKD